MSDLKITELKYSKDGVDYMVNGAELKSVNIPKNYTSKISITMENGPVTSMSVEKLKIEIEGENSQETLERFPNLQNIKSVLEDDIDKLKALEYGFIKLEDYQDITDYEFNNFDKIEKEILISSGSWAGNGMRTIELNFSNELDESHKISENKSEKITAELNFYEKNNDKLTDPIPMKINRRNGKYYLQLDTNIMTRFFSENDSEHSFYGKIKICSIGNNEHEESEISSCSFLFPFEIKIKNPIIDHAKTEEISIDFGTSSTCISYEKGKKLLSFSDRPKDIEDYENMTALIIYNWEGIYKAWRKDNSTIPHMKRSKNDADNVKLTNDYFDYGDTIKGELEEAPTSKTIAAIITKLKSIPASFENNEDYKENIKPFDKNSFKKQVYLTDKVANEDEQTLNPIALYGYLIGRSLNTQVGNKLYSKYNLTMPVNFSKYKKNRIMESLEYGLRRALPDSIKEDLELKNDYQESVALLGAAKKLKHLKIEDGKEATLFAVFDFGGGTLDFAFGLYRKASDDTEVSVFKNEDNQYRNIIEIFKTDGELVGGETLIESLSWDIYKNNQESMKEKNIPIYVPEQDEGLTTYPKKLMVDTHIAKVNLKSLNEKFSRDFFINGEFSKSKVTLYDVENKPQEIEMEHLNEEKANEFLSEEIRDLVDNFHNVLQDTFENNLDRIKRFGFDTFEINDVKILQAGNACKAKWIKESFDEIFKEHKNTIFINDLKKEITPKNAVAKGSLMLESVGVFDHSAVKGSEHLSPLD
nr:hypothetical protein [Sulfurovaceae bacterium]